MQATKTGPVYVIVATTIIASIIHPQICVGEGKQMHRQIKRDAEDNCGGFGGHFYSGIF